MYCIREDNDIYKVYMVYYDKESEIFINEYQYSLCWLLIRPYNLYTQIDTKKDKQLGEVIEKLSI